jgi:hypothetical protein
MVLPADNCSRAQKLFRGGVGPQPNLEKQMLIPKSGHWNFGKDHAPPIGYA